MTLVNWRFEVVYETLVKPSHPVLDYNTVFSGLQPGDLAHVTTTLEDVQNVLLQLICADTILIGWLDIHGYAVVAGCRVDVAKLILSLFSFVSCLFLLLLH